MIIPTSSNTGHPTVSPTGLRRYGASEFECATEESPRGCPRQWKARYVERRVERDDNDLLRMGRVVHRALDLRESEMLSPEEALERAWDTALSLDVYTDCLQVLRAYDEREATPTNNLGTLAVERNLTALLYDDDVYGPTWCQARLDRLAVNLDVPDVIDVIDFKSGWVCPSIEDVERDAQLKMQAWLVFQCWAELGLVRPPRLVVVHLDALRYRELPGVAYTLEDLSAWHAWTVAIVRAIWRDTEAKPRLNEGCARCPVRDDCPVYEGLPELARSILSVKPEDRDAQVVWRDKAYAARNLLDKAVKEVDGRFASDARLLGEVRAGGYVWRAETSWGDVQDMRALHDVLEDRFYDAVTITKAALEREAKTHPDPQALWATRSRAPLGTTVKKSKE